MIFILIFSVDDGYEAEIENIAAEIKSEIMNAYGKWTYECVDGYRLEIEKIGKEWGSFIWYLI